MHEREHTARQIAAAVIQYLERTKGAGHSTAARMGLQAPVGGAKLVTLKGANKDELKLSEAPSWASQWRGPIVFDNEALIWLLGVLHTEIDVLNRMLHGDYS